MSANNILKIYSKVVRGKKKWVVEHWDLDCGKYTYYNFKKSDNLEGAIKEAYVFMEENIVEYGLSISPE